MPRRSNGPPSPEADAGGRQPRRENHRSHQSRKLLVDIQAQHLYLKFIDLFLAELWLLRDWHRALNEPSF
ncbi:hypothetical protein CYG48_20915 (plasmid) [Neorhizobium sp. SOG26]|nr:hypothetical protein CYG48_20915 [Neorhizobium sp. SOG26]